MSIDTEQATIITATALARNLSDILNRVHYRGERFVVQRNGEEIAVLEPKASKARVVTWADFAAAWPTIPPPDDAFADDMEAIIAAQPLATMPPWEE